ncbi:MAG TPA: hypothetical protein VFI71_07895, partial [Pyrinomonadaceae bacterium]|nr:hypothetical protein [Pyrinomonadaceae bacterium]
MRILLLLTLILCPLLTAGAQTPVSVIWQVTSFDINANVQQNERSLSAVATIAATNVGNGPGRTMTLRLNSKASVKSVTVGGATASFRQGPEPRGDLQKIEISLPASVAPGGNVTAAVTYTLSVESNSGLAAISPIGTEFLPLSFWYP